MLIKSYAVWGIGVLMTFATLGMTGVKTPSMQKFGSSGGYSSSSRYGGHSSGGFGGFSGFGGGK